MTTSKAISWAHRDACGPVFPENFAASTTENPVNNYFESCSFKKAQIESPTLDDAIFVGCTFEEAQIKGRGWNEFGGKRMVFEDCCFDGCVFRNLQLRACKFVRCNFDDAAFKKCIMSGISFREGEPKTDAFEECEIQECVVDGEPLLVDR